MILSVLPIVAVVSRVAFAVKIGGLVVVVNIVGTALYLRARRPNGRPADG